MRFDPDGKNKVSRLIQVCAQVTDKNFDWEYNGPVEIINVLGLTEGTIVAMDQRDRFEKNGKVVRIIHPHKYLSES